MRRIFLPLIVSALIVSLTGCTSHATRKAVVQPQLRGIYSFEKKETKNGAQITTREMWHLVPVKGGTKVTMDYFRMGHSLSGFPCSGAPSFTIHLRFVFPPAPVKGGGITLGKPTVTHTANPCDDNLPEPAGDRLLILPGERLRHMGKKGEATTLHPFTATGVWVWKRVTPAKNSIDSKVEIERWSLVQGKDGRITGYSDRAVVRRSFNKRPYSCNGKESIWFFSRYAVEGTITKMGRISLRETGYQVPTHDSCEPSGKRYLDRYTGVLIGDSIHLKSAEEKIEQTLEREYGAKSVSGGALSSRGATPVSTQPSTNRRK